MHFLVMKTSTNLEDIIITLIEAPESLGKVTVSNCSLTDWGGGVLNKLKFN